MILGRYDVRQPERTDDHDDRDGGKDKGDFVADHLCNRAHGAQQGVFVVARPASHKHRQFHGPAHGEEKQHARVKIHSGHVAPDRQHRVGQQHRDEQDDRRQKMHRLVRRMRHDVFLGQRFQAVGNELAEAAQTDLRQWNADAIGAVAVLDAAEALALNDRDEGEQRGKQQRDERNRNQGGHKRPPSVGEPSHRLVLQRDKNLVQGIKHGPDRRVHRGLQHH